MDPSVAFATSASLRYTRPHLAHAHVQPTRARRLAGRLSRTATCCSAFPTLAPGASARCPRCDKELWRRREDSLDRTLALTLAAAVLYVVANSVPMLGLDASSGAQASTTVLGGAQQLWHDGREIVAVLVLFTAVVAPALQIGFMLAIVLGARRRAPRRAGSGRCCAITRPPARGA